jgi:hypothetical protein
VAMARVAEMMRRRGSSFGFIGPAPCPGQADIASSLPNVEIGGPGLLSRNFLRFEDD